jgi:hypothetical protein
MGVKISNLPKLSSSPIGFGADNLPNLTNKEITAIVQGLTTYQCPISAFGGVIFSPTLSSFFVRSYSYPTNDQKLPPGVGSIDLQYLGSNASQSVLGKYSNILGGGYNSVRGDFTTIAGGSANLVSLSCTGGAVVGGTNNRVLSAYGFIGGGKDNTVNSDFGTIGGGVNNTAAQYGTVAGGLNNLASYLGVVGGGLTNNAPGILGFVGGGNNNNANASYTVIVGGVNNTTNASYGFIGGGDRNNVGGAYGTIVGGLSNFAFGDYTYIGSGSGNFAFGGGAAVFSGVNNTATGNNSIVVGGVGNTSQASNTFILGSNITANTANFTYVNNITSEGNVRGVTVITPGGNSNNWNSVYTTVTAQSANFAQKLLPINGQTNTNYTLSLSDSSSLVSLSSSNAMTLIVPLYSNIAFLSGTQIPISQIGTGQVTVSATAGVTLNSRGGRLKLNGQYATASLINTGTNIWLLAGDLTT